MVKKDPVAIQTTWGLARNAIREIFDEARENR
jgi:hypothetical protein